MRRLGPCKILAKYENMIKNIIFLHIALSPLFNLVELVPYKYTTPDKKKELYKVVETTKNLPLTSPSKPQVERILGLRVEKKKKAQSIHGTFG